MTKQRTSIQRELSRDMVARLLASHVPDDEIVETIDNAVDFEFTGSMLSGDKTAISKRWQEKSSKGYSEFVEQELVRLESLEEIAWTEYRRCAGKKAVTETTKSLAGTDVDWVAVERVVKEAPNSIEIRYWFDRIIQIQAERRDLLGLKAQLIHVNMQKRIVEEKKMYITFDPDVTFPDPPARLNDPDTIEGEYVEA